MWTESWQTSVRIRPSEEKQREKKGTPRACLSFPAGCRCAGLQRGRSPHSGAEVPRDHFKERVRTPTAWPAPLDLKERAEGPAVKRQDRKCQEQPQKLSGAVQENLIAEKMKLPNDRTAAPYRNHGELFFAFYSGEIQCSLRPDIAGKRLRNGRNPDLWRI